MSTPAPERTELLAELRFLTLEHSGRSVPLSRDPDNMATLEWWVTGEIIIDDDNRYLTEAEGVFFDHGERGSSQRSMFSMSGIVIDLMRNPDPLETLDAHSQDMSHFAPLLSPSRQAELDGLLQGIGNRLVIIDRVRLAPAWRHLGGVGRLLIGESLQWLRADAQLVATYPHPFELDDIDQSDPRFIQAREQVRHTWSDLGFQPFDEDLYVLDPALVHLDDALVRLRRKLSAGR